MMEESAEEAMKREEMFRTYHAFETAFRIINDLLITTVLPPVPPLVKNDGNDWPVSG